jgi:hypothetical protein
VLDLSPDGEVQEGQEVADAVLAVGVLEHVRDPAGLLRRVRPFVADGGAVIAAIPNVAHASVRLALLAGRVPYRSDGPVDESHVRVFTRDSIQHLFEEAGYVVTHWLRVTTPLEATGALEELLAQDAEASTREFVVRAVPSSAGEQLAAVRSLLDEARVELERLRPESELREELQRENEALRHANEAQARHLVAERLALAEEVEREVGKLRDELEWRKGVMEHQEAQFNLLQSSRSLRYTQPLRRLAAAVRRR